MTLGLVLALATAAGLFYVVSSTAYAGTTGDISSLALANVGKKACSTNSLGGSYYYSSCTGNGGEPEYWCADFARWVWGHEGIDHTGDLTAAAVSFYNYAKKYGTFSTTPTVGDVAVFSNTGAVDEIHHVAVVSKVSSGTIETVSGDWGGESGTQAHFASTSHVVLNSAYSSGPGYKSSMQMYLVGYASPVGVTTPTPPQGSGAAVYDGGHYHVFGVTAAGTLYEDSWDGSSWSGWVSLGGTVTGSPGVTYHDGRFDVFAAAPGGAMYQKTWDGSWGAWHSIGGTFPAGSGATAVYDGGHYHVFAVGTTGAVYEDSWDGSSWSGWASLGGNLTGTPGVTYHDGRFDVFAAAPGGAMYQKTWDGSWGAWHSIGGTFPVGAGVGAVYNGNGHYHVFGVGTTAQLYEDSWDGSSWSGWSSLGGNVTGAPAVTYHDGRFDVFEKTPAGPMYQKTWDGSWGDWHSIGGDFT